jgi:hypothetical protein
MKTTLSLIISLFILQGLHAQYQERLPFLEPADTFHKARFWTCAGAGAAIYGAASVGLYQAWYKQYELTTFRTFNDWGEWEDMDKVGHLVTAYNESKYSFDGLLWTGTERRKSMWMAAGVGMLLQSTVEFMDAHSEKWGFSWADMGFNVLGVGAFVSQELVWQEQRIKFKISSSAPNYPDILIRPIEGEAPPMSIQDRARNLYGTTFGERVLKDYNGQTLWASVNIASMLGGNAPNWLPQWLNIATGYGANNMLGGFSNKWEAEDGSLYVVSNDIYPRYRQFHLSLDADLSRIPTRKRWLRFLLSTVNWIKIPAPSLEYNTNGGLRFHALHW